MAKRAQQQPLKLRLAEAFQSHKEGSSSYWTGFSRNVETTATSWFGAYGSLVAAQREGEKEGEKEREKERKGERDIILRSENGFVC